MFMKEIIRTYENVYSFSARTGNLLVYFLNKELSVNNVVVEEDLTDTGFDLYDDVVFYSKYETSTCIYRIANKSKVIFQKYFQRESYVNGIGVFYEDKAFYNVDMSTGNILSTFTLGDIASRSYFKDHILCSSYENGKQERVLCYDRLKQMYLWEYNVTEEGRYVDDIIRSPEKPGEVKAILGMYKSIVIIAITGERLIAFDVNTGKKVWKIESIPEAVLPYMKFPHLPSAMNFKMEADTGSLVSFHQNIYINIDIETGKVKEVVNVYDKYGNMTLAHHNWYKEGRIIYYFTAGFHRGVIPQVIAYDLDRRAVIWTHIIQHENLSQVFTKYFLKSMQYDQGIFFVLDSNDVLHILKN
jgi:outer membrane protein assembly factor BamB